MSSTTPLLQASLQRRLSGRRTKTGTATSTRSSSRPSTPSSSSTATASTTVRTRTVSISLPSSSTSPSKSTPTPSSKIPSISSSSSSSSSSSTKKKTVPRRRPNSKQLPAVQQKLQQHIKTRHSSHSHSRGHGGHHHGADPHQKQKKEEEEEDPTTLCDSEDFEISSSSSSSLNNNNENRQDKSNGASSAAPATAAVVVGLEEAYQQQLLLLQKQKQPQKEEEQREGGEQHQQDDTASATDSIPSAAPTPSHTYSRSITSTSSSSESTQSSTTSERSGNSSVFSGVIGRETETAIKAKAKAKKAENAANNNNKMLAAESFQRAYDNASSKVVPRFETFAATMSSQNSTSTNNSSLQQQQQHVLQDDTEVIPAPSTGRRGGGGTSPNHKEQQRIRHGRGEKQKGPFACGDGSPGATAAAVTSNAVQNWTPVAREAAGRARDGVKELVLVAAEVFRHECRSDQRGDDAAFFVQQKEQAYNEGGVAVVDEDGDDMLMIPDQNSLLEKDSLHSGEQRDEKGSSSMAATTGASAGGDSGRKSASSTRSGRNSSDLNRKLEKGRAKASKDATRTPGTTATATTQSSHSDGSTSANENHHQTLSEPPKVDRKHQQLSTKTFHPSTYSPYGHHDEVPAGYDIPREVTAQPAVDKDELRASRMKLFQSSGAVEPNEPGTKLARALEDLNRQDVFIQSLRRQMQLTQASLDSTVEELDAARASAKNRKVTPTEMRALATEEKKRLEDQYKQEVEHGKKLQEEVSQLQREISTLKVSLRNARSSSQKTGPVPEEGSSASPSVAKTNNAQLISLKAEIVDLRSQLAEAHAATIEGTSALHSTAEVEDLKNKLRIAESELASTRQKHRSSIEERERLFNEHEEMKQRLEFVESSSNETKERLEENLMIAMKSADDVRAELVKTKANLQRLERERSRARLESSPDVSRLTSDLGKAREESANLKNELEQVQSQAELDRDAWTKEVEALREKLQNTNQETLSRSGDRIREQRRLHDELSRNVSEIKMLKDTLNLRDKQLEAKSSRLEELERMIRTGEGRSTSEVGAGVSDMEDAFMNELASLKAKLSDKSQLLLEESFRVQEKDRINRELELEVAELRRRLAQGSIAQTPRSSMNSMNSRSIEETTKKEFWSIPNGNVTRLRSELARARDRLVAARENTRSTPTPRSSINSSSDDGQSTWGPPTATAVTPSAASNRKASLEELTQQLTKSKERLHKVDQKLNGLVNEGEEVMTIVRKSTLDSSFDGSIDQVVDNDGEFEVKHSLFADV